MPHSIKESSTVSTNLSDSQKFTYPEVKSIGIFLFRVIVQVELFRVRIAIVLGGLYLLQETPISFDFSEDTQEQEQSHSRYTAYAREASIDWYKSDQEDIENLALPGDEDHLKGGYWNSSDANYGDDWE